MLYITLEFHDESRIDEPMNLQPMNRGHGIHESITRTHDQKTHAPRTQEPELQKSKKKTTMNSKP